MDIHFSIADKQQQVQLIEGSGSHSVAIGGRHYTLLGSAEAICFIKECLVPADSLEQAGKELKARMWLQGAKEVSVTTTHAIGLTVLGKNEAIDKQAIIGEIATLFETSYVDETIGKQCAAYLKKQLAEGAYEGITDGDVFTQAITADLRHIAEDKHIVLYVSSEEAAPEQAVERYQSPELTHPFTFKGSEEGLMGASPDEFPYEIRSGFIEEKTGYIDLRLFGTTRTESADSRARRHAIIDAVHNIQGAETVIVDLRNNGGGDPATVQLLCSLFIEEGLPLNTIQYRGEPLQEFATLSHQELPLEQRLTAANLFVLIGPRTFSAAEEFTNNIKVLNRGRVVGEPSGGGANPGTTRQVGEGDKFVLFIPTGRAVNPIQGGNWEGVGIIPDQMAPAEEALEVALKLRKHTPLDT